MTYNKNTEANDLLDEMKRVGMVKFAEMFGKETLESIKTFAAEEERLNPIRQQIRLQAKLMGDYPLCEKCVHWGGVSGVRSKPCPYENLEKNISFEKNDLCSQQSFDVEVCEKFEWKV